MTGMNKLAFSFYHQIGTQRNFLFFSEYAFRKSDKIHVLRSLDLYDSYEFSRYESDRSFTMRKGIRHGFAILAAKQELESHRQSVVKPSYARHLILNNTTHISMGLALGFAKLDQNELSQVNAFFDSGITLYSKGFLVGYSIRNIGYAPLSERSQSAFFKPEEKQRLFIQARHYLIHPLFAETFISLTKETPTPARLELGANLEYNELLNIGFNFSEAKTFVWRIGLYIQSQIQFFYSYSRTDISASSELHVSYALDN